MVSPNTLRVLARGFTTSSSRSTQGSIPTGEAYRRIMDRQGIMCANDGLLVWQKKGARDSFGYYATLGLMVAGFVPMVGIIYKLAFPRKN